jgi:hypothetical protein
MVHRFDLLGSLVIVLLLRVCAAAVSGALFRWTLGSRGLHRLAQNNITFLVSRWLGNLHERIFRASARKTSHTYLALHSNIIHNDVV